MKADDPAERATEFEQLLETAHQLLVAGEPIRARDMLIRALRYSDDVWGEDAAQLIEPLQLLAWSHSLEHGPLNRNKDAEVAYLERALEIARRRLGSSHIAVAEVLARLGSNLRVAGKTEDGCRLVLEAVEIARQNDREAEFAYHLLSVGMVWMANGRLADASGLLERAADLERSVDEDSLGHALTRFHLGKSLVLLGEKARALEELDTALQVADRLRRQGGKHAPLMNDIMALIDRAQSLKSV